MKTADQWFEAYGVSHQNATNKLIHWICVPLIFFSIVGLLSAIPTGFLSLQANEGWKPYIHFGTVLILLGMLFYIRLSISLALGMAVISAFILYLIKLMLLAELPVGWISFAIFVLAWIGQFIGHKIEGAKPSFFEDLQFLLIGPIWLLGFVYKRLGVPY